MTMYLEKSAAAIRAALDRNTKPPPDSDFLFVLYAILLRSKGDAVTSSDVHDAWSAWISISRPDHEAIKPFDELQLEIQQEDEPYAEAIRRVAVGRGRH